MFMLAAATTGSATRRWARGHRPRASTYEVVCHKQRRECHPPLGAGSQTPREHIRGGVCHKRRPMNPWLLFHPSSFTRSVPPSVLVIVTVSILTPAISVTTRRRF